MRVEDDDCIKVRDNLWVGETTWGERDPAIWIDGVKTVLSAPYNDESWGGADMAKMTYTYLEIMYLEKLV